MSRLRERDRELLRKRYELELSVKEISAQVQRSVMALHQALHRIHKWLAECVRLTLASSDEEV